MSKAIKLYDFMERVQFSGLYLNGCYIQGTATLFKFIELDNGKVHVTWNGSRDTLVDHMYVSKIELGPPRKRLRGDIGVIIYARRR